MASPGIVLVVLITNLSGHHLVRGPIQPRARPLADSLTFPAPPASGEKDASKEVPKGPRGWLTGKKITINKVRGDFYCRSQGRSTLVRSTLLSV